MADWRMTNPAATRKDHERFCTTEGWTPRTTATGRTGTHHVNYELALPDGRVLWTRISHPVNRTTYGRSLWAHILREQMDVTDSEFWACARDGVLPDRGAAPEPPNAAIPLEVATTLIRRFHVPEHEVRDMTKDEAIALLIAKYNE